MPDPNNIALRDHGLVFMLLPKVANTSIKMSLARALGMECDPGTIHQPGRFEYVSTKEAKTFAYRIAFVRDPLDRLLSCYRDKVIGSPTPHVVKGLRHFCIQPFMYFEGFVKVVADIPDEACNGVAQHFRSMHHSLCEPDGSIIPNVVGRFEALEEHWERVRDTVHHVSGLHLPRLDHYRRTDRDLVKYSAKARAFALQRYRDDVRIFGYRQPRKYPIDPDGITLGRSICNVHREAYQIARDRITDKAVSGRMCDLIAEAFDMGKRMNAKLRGSQYEA